MREWIEVGLLIVTAAVVDVRMSTVIAAGMVLGGGMLLHQCWMRVVVAAVAGYCIEGTALAFTMTLLTAKNINNLSKALNWCCIGYFSIPFFQHIVTIQSLLCACLLTIHIVPQNAHLVRLSIPWFFFIYSIQTQLYLQILQSNWHLMIGLSASLCICTYFIFTLLSSTNCRPSSLRKLFHLPALILIPVGQLLSPRLLVTQLFGCYFILQYVEMFRMWLLARQSSLATWFQGMRPVLDQRDEGEWFSHLSLLLGYAYPCAKRAPFVAVLFVIGDAMAAIVGKLVGSRKLPFQDKRTLAGSTAFLVTSLSLGTIFNLPLKPTLLASISGTLLQGYTNLLDNLSVPMMMTHLYLLFMP